MTCLQFLLGLQKQTYQDPTTLQSLTTIYLNKQSNIFADSNWLSISKYCSFSKHFVSDTPVSKPFVQPQDDTSLPLVFHTIYTYWPIIKVLSITLTISDAKPIYKPTIILESGLSLERSM